MAKVIVSLPDDLLRLIDAEAVSKNTTRSGLLRDYLYEGLRHRAQQRALRIEAVMKETSHHGGGAVSDLKRLRP